jgi:hypothetical protein
VEFVAVGGATAGSLYIRSASPLIVSELRALRRPPGLEIGCIVTSFIARGPVCKQLPNSALSFAYTPSISWIRSQQVLSKESEKEHRERPLRESGLFLLCGYTIGESGHLPDSCPMLRQP